MKADTSLQPCRRIFDLRKAGILGPSRSSRAARVLLDDQVKRNEKHFLSPAIGK
jgi:hypothetical protein